MSEIDLREPTGDECQQIAAVAWARGAMTVTESGRAMWQAVREVMK